MNVIATQYLRRKHMKAFTITDDSRISLLDPKQATSEAAQIFGTEEELATLAAEFPAARLVALWNNLPGAQPVKKFTDRKTAIARIWKAVQALTPAPAAQEPDV